MVSWPKSILTLGANLLTARAAVRLKRDRSRAQQRGAFRGLMRKLAATAHWRGAGVEPGMDYASFRERVRLHSYPDVEPAILRMLDGESDVLWPGHCMFFATSSGTSTGTPKTVPVTSAMLAHFRRGCRDALLFYTARVGHAGVFRGRHLFVTGSTGLTPRGAGPDGRTFVGEWPAIAALNLPDWAESRFYEPGMEIGLMTEWQAKIDAIVERTANRDISVLAGMPPWVLPFADALRAKKSVPAAPIETLQTLWPNLEVYVHGGVPIAPYAAELRSVLGASVNFHEVYAGAEGFYAAQDAATPDLRVFADAGVFFEFVPLADFDGQRPDSMGTKAVPLADVKTGIDYVVLLTTPAGLVRYVVEDVVRFTSVRPPRLVYAGRTSLLLSAFGERVLERDITQVLVAVCQRHRWSIVNFHVAPLFDVALTGSARGRHEWWIELKPGTVETPTGPQMAMELDAELQRTNPSYAERRASGRIDAPTVRLVMPGVFRHWLRYHGKWGGQNKVARCRSDRAIADELAQITKFARDQL